MKKTQKKQKREKRQARTRALNLNLILWLSFLLFAVLLIALFALVQNFQLNRRYSEQIKKNLQEAAQSLRERLENNKLPLAQESKILLSVTNEYNVSVYLFSADGEIVFPDLPEEEEDFQSIISEIRSSFDNFIKENEENGNVTDMKNVHAEIKTDHSEGYSFLLTQSEEKQYYVYLTSSFELLHRLSADMKWYTLITALFAVALSFVVSGFMSMLITKPVTEVTERAKELARGNYEGSRGTTYFCTELNELSQSLDYASSEIGKTDKMQKELIANVSHDFKTPLTMIKAYAAMIREISGNDPEKREKHTQIIIDEADRLAALVGDVLDLSRLQTGIDETERTVFNLTEDVYAVAGRFGYLTETQGFTLETEIDEDIYTYAGKARVEQVLYNLIGNAFNYTGEDKRVTVRLKRQRTCARFEVEDTGKGIPPEEIDTIWERYYRSSEMHKRPVQGTGLGLSIVKSVLLKYSIPFGVQSEDGKGSCFWVDFPLPPDES